MADSKKRDLLSDAKNFCDGLSNVFMLKKRDPQTRHLLEKAKLLIENLISENQRGTSNVTSTPRGSRTAGGMGQLWVKLDELKRENEELRKQAGKPADDRPSLPPKPSQGPGDVIIGDLHKTKRENEALKAKVERLETRIREMEGVALSVQDEYKRAKVALETTQKSMETVLKDYRQMEDELKLAKKENESLKQKYVYHYAKSSQYYVTFILLCTRLTIDHILRDAGGVGLLLLVNPFIYNILYTRVSR